MSFAQEAKKEWQDPLAKGDFWRLNSQKDDHLIKAVEGCVEKWAGMSLCHL